LFVPHISVVPINYHIMGQMVIYFFYAIFMLKGDFLRYKPRA
ncbi:hypothetical protein J2Z49_002768, partial [Desulfofundulus luciae]|nr:hypothetical protein [Desulfofundulus luciae]